MRKLAGGVAVAVIAAMTMSTSANAGMVYIPDDPYSVQLSYQPILVERLDAVIATRGKTAITVTERGGLVVPFPLDPVNLVTFLTNCTVGLVNTTCRTTKPGAFFGASVFGGSANDRISGQGSDPLGPLLFLHGGAGNDTIIGSSGGDALEGALGNDVVEGGAGNDTIEQNDLGEADGNDVFRGGDGNDKIVSADLGMVDQVFCGPGDDTVVADIGIDTIAADCEHVFPYG